MILTLPYPPSINRLYATFRGRRLISREGRAYKSAVEAIMLQKRIRPISDPVRLTMRFYRPRKVGDLDNGTKALLDSLTGFAWIDDSQICEMHSYRFDDKDNPRVELEWSVIDCGANAA